MIFDVLSKAVGNDLKARATLAFPSKEQVLSTISIVENKESDSYDVWHALYILFEWHRFLRPGATEDEVDLQVMIFQAIYDTNSSVVYSRTWLMKLVKINDLVKRIVKELASYKALEEERKNKASEMLKALAIIKYNRFKEDRVDE